jgi:PadR family transcriptional regulator PadR
MRRKQGELVPLEVSILEASVDLAGRGTPEAHGFLLAREMRDQQGARRLTAYGTLYKALDRLERIGYLASRWEDPMVAAAEGRPRRRFYRTTVVGEQALRAALEARSKPVIRRPAAAVQP